MRQLVTLLFGLLLTGCTIERFAPAVDAKVDSALTAAGIPPLHAHKLVFRGPVTLQVGQGNTSSTVGTDKTGQRSQAVSTGAHSPVAATEKKGGAPWWVFVGVGVLGAIVWQLIKQKVNPLKWLASQASS